MSKAIASEVCGFPQSICRSVLRCRSLSSNRDSIDLDLGWHHGA
jgi:hypothetical protein